MTFLISWRLFLRLARSIDPAEEAWLIEQGQTINAVVCDSSIIRAHAVRSEELARPPAMHTKPPEEPPLDVFFAFAKRFFPPACRVAIPETEDFGFPEVARRLKESDMPDFIFAFEVHEALRNGRTYLCTDDSEMNGVRSVFPEISASSISQQLNE